jgi:ataxia telangiectasia mutated family protein
MLILKLNSVHVPVLTVNTPVDPALQYQNCIWISHYESTFETAGGVNIPKKYYCRGSGGAKCMQLLKGEGNDDLRQDAVMEHCIRGYKVIPLAHRQAYSSLSANTCHWLARAHLQYNKGDVHPQEFHRKMSKMERFNATHATFFSLNSTKCQCRGLPSDSITHGAL